MAESELPFPERRLEDFNDSMHRVASASAAYQKGIYHMFVLARGNSADAYSQVLRMYQCLFLLCLAQLLLDFDFDLKLKWIDGRLRNLCPDPEHPTRASLDPAALVHHSIFEKKIWKGFGKNHQLHKCSEESLELYAKVVEARHNLIYPPFMLDQLYEDCTLISLLEQVPSISELESAYRSFLNGMMHWHQSESRAHIKTLGSGTRIAAYFFELLFMVYRDVRGLRPTETLFLSYARLLNPSNKALLADALQYRNMLIDYKNLIRISGILVLASWNAGEL